MKDIGKMEKDMALEWKLEADGYTEVNGHKGLKADMAWGKVYRQRLGMKAHGLTASKMDTDPKRTPMEVSRNVSKNIVY